MNNVLCRATDAELSEYRLQADRFSMNVSPIEESYLTAPMLAMASPSTSEEDLHTSFEAAISGRLLAMQERMERISSSLQYNQQRRYETEILPAIEKQSKNTKSLFYRRCQHVVLFGCCGLLLIITGFDLMGLLILCTR